MSRLFKHYLIFAIVGSVLLIVVGIKYVGDIYYGALVKDKRIIKTTSIAHNNEDSLMQLLPSASLPNYSNSDFEYIIEKTRSKIKYKLSKYNFSQSGVRKLENLLLESGGKPIRSIIISSWRSGSTFFGEMLESIPGTYYHYEPLLPRGVVQIRSPPDSNEAVNNLKHLLKCNYDEVEDYFEFGKSETVLFQRNKNLWEHCKLKKDLCFNAQFTSRFCKLFPFQAMKLCRLRLRFVQEMLDDDELNMKVILLIRDPRGVFNSRRQQYFCQRALDCWQPELLCADMIRDYVAASQLMPLYPDRLMVVRFEDMALNLKVTIHRVLNFLRLNATTSIDEFLKSHTNYEVIGFDSTFRVSRNIPFKWKHSMNFTDIDEIQMVCKEAMRLWGYRMAHNATHLISEEFNPIENYVIQRISD